MNIDVHCHYAASDFPTQARRELGDAAPSIMSEPGGTEVLVRSGMRIRFQKRELSRLTSIEDRLRVMDECGIRIQAISPPTFFFFYNEPPEAAARLCALLNDGLAKAVRDHPDRLIAMAAVPLQDTSLAVAEMERAKRALDARAVYVGSSVNGRGLDDKEFWPFYEAAETLQIPIFIHPMSSDLAGADRMGRYLLHNLIGNPLDTTLAAAQLIFGGVFERFPHLQICLAHGGGYLAWAIGRMDRGYAMHPDCREALTRSPGEFLDRFYVDTIVHSPKALSYLINLFGADHVLCGSDYPFQIGDPDPIQTIEVQEGLAETERTLIRSENAARLLRIEDSHL